MVQGLPPLNASGEPIGGDFIAFHSAARLVLTGHADAMYDRDALADVQTQLLGDRIPNFFDAYRNPPFFALVYLPFAPFDLIAGFVLYTLVSLALLVLAVWLLLRDDSLVALRSRWRGLMVLIVAFPAVFFGLIDGENATLSLLVSVALYRGLRRGQAGRVGAYAALGLFKPQMFAIWPLFFVARRAWHSLIVYGVTAAGLALISLLVVGPHGLGQWWHTIVDLEASNSAATAWRMVSLKAFFEALLPGAPPVGLGLYALAAIAVLAALIARWHRACDPAAPLFLPPQTWLVTLLAASLVNPHMVDYDLTSAVATAPALLMPEFRSVRWAAVVLYGVSLLRASADLPFGRILFVPLVLLLGFAIAYRQSRSLVRVA